MKEVLKNLKEAKEAMSRARQALILHCSEGTITDEGGTRRATLEEGISFHTDLFDDFYTIEDKLGECIEDLTE